jgi:non-homologous end joining protein Ku
LREARDVDTGEEVSSDDIMKGYKVADSYIKFTKDELENIALDSNSATTFAVIRENIRDIQDVKVT